MKILSTKYGYTTIHYTLDSVEGMADKDIIQACGDLGYGGIVTRYPYQKVGCVIYRKPIKKFTFTTRGV